MNRKKQTAFRLFVVLFMIFIFAPASSSTIILSYGLLGQVKSVLVSENQVQIQEQKNKADQNNIESQKDIQIFNIWLLILAIILYIKYALYGLRLPRKNTLVLMKVCIDN